MNDHETRKIGRDILIGAAGAIVAGLIVTAAEGIFGALSSLLGPPVPSGAVVAFNTAFDSKKCPEGWEHYQLGAGRFLLGSGKGRELHADGGAETHTLTVPEMPTHNHDSGKYSLVVKSHTETTDETDDIGGEEINVRRGFPMVSQGEGKAHNNMPPFLVVNFCKKK